MCYALSHHRGRGHLGHSTGFNKKDVVLSSTKAVGPRDVIWEVLGGGGGGGELPPSRLKLPPPPQKPQLAPHIPQAPRSNSSWFSIIPTEIQMCNHFSITFSYILYVFFFVFFLQLRQGRSQGRLASDKK